MKNLPKFKVNSLLIAIAAISGTLSACNGAGSSGNTTNDAAQASVLSQTVRNTKIIPATLNTNLNSSGESTANYRVYVTSKIYTGNLGGIVGADNICNSDSKNPDLQQANRTRYFKAMVNSSSDRYACNADASCGIGYSYDWVLQPDSQYFNDNDKKELIAQSTNTGIFTFDLTGPFSTESQVKVWTGLHSNWATGGSNCSNWSSGSSGKDGIAGLSDKLSTKALNEDSPNCDSKRSLYCIEQPPSVMLSPQNGATLQDTSASIVVAFNSIYGIESTTVNTNSFQIYLDSQPQSALAGVISESGGKFSLKPTYPLLHAKTYTVNLTNEIKDKNGNQIYAGQFHFATESSSTRVIFLSANEWWGDLGGVSGADEKCSADAKCYSHKCRALISNKLTRMACNEDGQCGPAYSKNWVLAPNTEYKNIYGATIGKTTESAIFNFSLSSLSAAISTSGKAWTGLSSSFHSSSNNCLAWSYGTGGKDYTIYGNYGDATSLTGKSILDDTGVCSDGNVAGNCPHNGGCSKRHLYCVQ